MKIIVKGTWLSYLMWGLLFPFAFSSAQACPGITVGVSVSTSGTCIPKHVSIQNTSTGPRSSTAIYQLYINNKLIDTAHGTTKTFNINLYRGNHSIKLLSIDTAGCYDSTQTSVNIAKTKPLFLDYQYSYSDTPQWVNCIQLSTDPDSFVLNTQNEDTLNALTIDWGDGQTNSFSAMNKDSALSHLYTTSGIFTVLLITTDTSGCVDTSMGRLTNERVPTAGIIGPNSGFNIGCAPFSVTFTNNSKNISNGTLFTWNMGDGTVLTKNNSTFNQNLVHTYQSTLCNATVQLTARNACGYSLTTWNPIQISKKDRAVFVIDSSNCDSSGYYRFLNYSTDSFCIFPDSKQFYWDFGDGTNSGWITSKAPQLHKYQTQGPKTVCLIAKNTCGNDTLCLPLTIVYTPVVGFEYDTLGGCESVTVSINDTSTGYGINRLWSFGDGTTSTAKQVSHTYTQPGTYTLNLRVGNRCGFKNRTETVVIKDKPKASFSGVSNGCMVHSLNLTNTSSSDFGNSVNFTWDFGNGDTSNQATPSTVQYTDSGTYTIQLIATDTCGADTVSHVLRVDRLPLVNIEADSALCSLDTVQFTNTSTDYDYLIVDYNDGSALDSIFNDSIFSHTYQVSGTYSVTIRAVNNSICESRDTITVIIKPNSISRFTLNDSTACAPFTFQFTNQSQYASSYKWFVNDTQVSTSSNLGDITLSSDSVVKNIKLVAIDTIGCLTDTFERTILTAKNPSAQMLNPIDSGCGPLVDTLRNTSQWSETYNWDGGNGVTQTSTNLTTTYPPKSSGDTTYSIRLIATNWRGCSDTTHGSRTVFPIPIPDFTMDTNNGCYPVVVNFTNTSSPNGLGSQADMKFAWDFGNGMTDTTTNPSGILFPESNTRDSIFTVRLEAVSANGCPAVKTSQVTVYPKPAVQFSASRLDGCGPLSVNFTNASVPNNFGSINIMQFDWSFGNDSSSTQASPNMIYTAASTKDTFYTVQLIGYSEHGCKDSADLQLQVYPKPFANFLVDTNTGCSPLGINFTNSSTPYDTSTINDMSFLWDFGEGSTSTTPSPTNTFFEKSYADTSYTIRLIALSEHGCTDTTNQAITVHPTPNAVFLPDRLDGCGPLLVNFSNQSQLNDSNFWDMGSGFNLANADTFLTFQALQLKDTIYTIRLHTKSKNGCESDTATHHITVYAQPISNFTILDDSLCEYETFEFSNTSQGATSYAWNYGDGWVDSLLNPTYQYSKGLSPGIGLDFTVQLKAISSHNCIDSSSLPVYVHPYTIAQIGNQIDSFCSPASINFINNSSVYTSSKWWFGDGDSSSNTTPYHFYQNISNVAKDIEVWLQTENNSGCFNRDTIHFRVLPEPIADFSPFRLDVCDSGYHTLVNVSINNTTNLWDFGDGSTSTEEEPYHLFKRNSNSETSYTIQLIVHNASQCPDTLSKSIRLNPIATVDFDTTVLPNVCVEDIVQFTNRSQYVVYHKWSFGDGGESRDSQPTYFYPSSGVFNLKYVGYDINGCADSITKMAMITVLDRPEANFLFTPKTPKMPNSMVSFTNQSSPNDGLSYAWDFGDPPSTSMLKDPTYQYPDSGWYTITQIVDNGFCRDTIVKRIYINPPLPLSNFSLLDSAGCSPLTVQFNQQSEDATEYRWFFDDGNESSDPNPSHTFTREGYYDITLVSYGPGGQSDTTFERLVRVYPSPTAFFTVTPNEKYLPNAVFRGQSESVGATSYVWEVYNTSAVLVETETEENPLFTLFESGQYSVDLWVQNEFGCRDSMSRPLYLTVLDSGHIVIPSAFTPTTSDGLNETFRPVMLSVSPTNYHFSVFNRWGEKIYETFEIDDAWDGTYLGSPCEMEQYLYLVEGQFYSGETFKRAGTVFLMK